MWSGDDWSICSTLTNAFEDVMSNKGSDGGQEHWFWHGVCGVCGVHVVGVGGVE